MRAPALTFWARTNYAPSQEAKRLRIANNIFEDIASTGEIAYFLQINGTDSVTVEHNTVQQGGNIMTSYGEPARNLVFRNNIIQFNLYGIACSVEKPTCPAIPFCNCFPGGTIKGNVIADNRNVRASYHLEKGFPGDSIVSSYDEVGFIDYARGNWQLAPRSKYRGKATDGKDPGVDYAALNASGVRSAKDGVASTPK